MSEREKFEKWLQQHDPDQSLTLAAEFPYYASYVTCMIAAAWQAALSTRKPCGYAVVDSEGKPLRSFRKSYVDEAHKFVKFFNENDIVGNPFRVVELFYEDSES